MGELEKKKEEAKEKGKEKGKPAGRQIAEREGEMDDDELSIQKTKSLNGLTQSAEYANSILPELRKMAGFEDSGIGTFREVPYGDSDDHKLSQIHSELVTAYHEGFFEGLQEAYEERLKELKGGK